MHVRPATPADAEAIARVHVRTWQRAYRGLLPQGYLDELSVEGRRPFWRGILDRAARDARYGVVVAEEDGEVVGFCSLGPNRGDEDGYDSELHAIYVLPEHQGRGAGRALTEAGLRELAEAGYDAVVLWVLRANSDARAFYEATGWELRGDEQLVRAGVVELPHVAYGRRDLERFS